MSLATEIAKEFSPDLLPAIIEQLSPEEQAELHGLLEAEEHDEIIRRCSERVVAHDRGPMYWIRNWTKTEDYQWQAKGLEKESATSPFPYKPHPEAITDWDYLDWVMKYILIEKELYIPKTREMMTSWLVCAYITWHCQFFPAIGWLAQSEKDDKAQGLIKYSNILYRNQPDWLRAHFPLKRHNEEGTKHRVDWANGSWFKALAQGQRQSASDHPHGWFNDESAHQPAWKAALNIAKPAVRQVICVSSAAASDFGIECDPSKAV